MMVTKEHRQALTTHLSLADGSAVAPLVMWGPLVQLLADEHVEASVAERTMVDNSTQWGILWLTKTRLIVGGASKTEDLWDRDSEDAGPADACHYWARPRTEVTAVELFDVETSRGHESDRRWRFSHRLTFRDGTAVTVPLLPRSGGAARDAAEALVSKLLRVGPDPDPDAQA